MSDNVEVISGDAQTQLKSIIDRIENLSEEKAAVQDQIKEVLLESKNNGFDTKIIKKVVKLRKQSKADRQNEDAVTQLYLEAIGEI
jgi:uncharacterized protein (UPF0335 family)